MAEETRTFGVHACLAIHRSRPGDVQRAWVTEETLGTVAEMLRDLARRRRPYRVVGGEELSRVAGVKHHEGVCIQAIERPAPSLEQLLEALGGGAARLVFLDGVRNPHNLGAILRVCAHFGAVAALGVRGEIPAPTGAARRVAEGAAEHVPVVVVDDAPAAIARLAAAGIVPIATAADAPGDLFEAELPERCLFLLGAERTGLSEPVRRSAKAAIAIAGTGAVDSLNVSTACAVLLGEHWRRHGDGGP